MTHPALFLYMPLTSDIFRMYSFAVLQAHVVFPAASRFVLGVQVGFEQGEIQAHIKRNRTGKTNNRGTDGRLCWSTNDVIFSVTEDWSKAESHLQPNWPLKKTVLQICEGQL